MGQRNDSKTWRISRYSSLKYGVMLNDILPSKGPSCCVYAERCPDYFKEQCVAGQRCPQESYFLTGFISSARAHYGHARTWLTEFEYEEVLSQLAVVSLQTARLSARIAAEECSIAETAIQRYAAALHRKRTKLTLSLVDGETIRGWFTT